MRLARWTADNVELETSVLKPSEECALGHVVCLVCVEICFTGGERARSWFCFPLVFSFDVDIFVSFRPSRTNIHALRFCFSDFELLREIEIMTCPQSHVWTAH